MSPNFAITLFKPIPVTVNSGPSKPNRYNVHMNYFFGYGSLVNQRTHVHRPCQKITLTGWRRAWWPVVHHPAYDRPAVLLTGVRDASSSIDGLIAPIDDLGRDNLDKRESGYDRHNADEHLPSDGPTGVAVYAVDPASRCDATHEHRATLSYLDVVIQGYWDEFGKSGAEAFFDTTDGWEVGFLNDRAAPLYPRKQNVPREIQNWIDAALIAKNAPVEDG